TAHGTLLCGGTARFSSGVETPLAGTLLGAAGDSVWMSLAGSSVQLLHDDGSSLQPAASDSLPGATDLVAATETELDVVDSSSLRRIDQWVLVSGALVHQSAPVTQYTSPVGILRTADGIWLAGESSDVTTIQYRFCHFNPAQLTDTPACTDIPTTGHAKFAGATDGAFWIGGRTLSGQGLLFSQ